MFVYTEGWGKINIKNESCTFQVLFDSYKSCFFFNYNAFTKIFELAIEREIKFYIQRIFRLKHQKHCSCTVLVHWISYYLKKILLIFFFLCVCRGGGVGGRAKFLTHF